jgi:hypothetical protein
MADKCRKPNPGESLVCQKAKGHAGKHMSPNPWARSAKTSKVYW